MIPVAFFMIVSFALFSIGIAGVAATRHFLLMILSIEIAIVASTLISTAFYYYNTAGNLMPLLFTMWTIAAVEAIALVAFFRYISKYEVDMDVTKLSKLRDR